MTVQPDTSDREFPSETFTNRAWYKYAQAIVPELLKHPMSSFVSTHDESIREIVKEGTALAAAVREISLEPVEPMQRARSFVEGDGL